MFEKRYLPHWITGLTILSAVIVLHLMGRVPICTCGYVKIWHGQTMSAENSQHIMDWYTPSHLLHGLLFYAILFAVAAKLSLAARMAVATVIEAGWEILENTNAIIEHYRAVTISLDYFGDSVVNSTADIFAMLLGFWLARHLPVWLSVFIVLGFEALTIYFIRDGLALNIIMLLYPLDVIKEWQSL